MDPIKPPDHSGMTGVPWLGRGRGLQPEGLAVGRSRGLPLSTEGPSVGRARGFLTHGDTPQGPGVTLPITEPVVGWARGLLVQPDDGRLGRARGLFFPAAEPKVGVARGTILPSLEPPCGPTPPCETMTRDKTEETSTLTTKEVVGTRNMSIHIPRANFLNTYFLHEELLKLLSAYRLIHPPVDKKGHWSPCLEEWALSPH